MDIMRKALDQARKGRFEILDKMHAAIATPREEISAYAPRIVTLKIPVERLVPLHLWIPAHANRRDVPAARRLERGEVELQTPFCVLLVLQAPARHRGNGRPAQEPAGIFQMLVAAEYLHPLTAVVFRQRRARHEDARVCAGRRLGQPVDGQHLLPPRVCQVAEDKHLRLRAQHALRHAGDLRRRGGHAQFGWRCG